MGFANVKPGRSNSNSVIGGLVKHLEWLANKVDHEAQNSSILLQDIKSLLRSKNRETEKWQLLFARAIALATVEHSKRLGSEAEFHAVQKRYFKFLDEQMIRAEEAFNNAKALEAIRWALVGPVSDRVKEIYPLVREVVGQREKLQKFEQIEADKQSKLTVATLAVPKSTISAAAFTQLVSIVRTVFGDKEDQTSKEVVCWVDRLFTDSQPVCMFCKTRTPQKK